MTYISCVLIVPLGRTGDTAQQGKGDAQTMLGACAVDVSTGHILLGQW